MPVNSINIKPRFGNDFLSQVGHSNQVFDDLGMTTAFQSQYRGVLQNWRVIHVMTNDVLVETIAEGLPADLANEFFQGQSRTTEGQVGYYDTIDLNALLRNKGYTVGQFKLIISYIRQGWSDIKLTIKEISSDRTEIKLQPQILPSAMQVPDDFAGVFKYAAQVERWWKNSANIENYYAPAPLIWKAGGRLNASADYGERVFDEFGNFVIGFHNPGMDGQNRFGFHEHIESVVNMKVSGWNQLPEYGVGRNMMGGTISIVNPFHAGVPYPGYPDDNELLIPLENSAGEFAQRNGEDGAGGFMALEQYTANDPKAAVVIKSLYPIPKSVKVGHAASLSYLLTDPREVNVKLTSAPLGFTGYQMAPPNFENKEHSKEKSGDFESWDSILSGSAETKQELISSIFSGSNLNQAELNIDYRKFDNFVHFSSAEERLKNFKFKMELMEYYQTKISSLENGGSSGSYWSLQNVDEYKTKQRKITNGLDGYEKFLYYSSGSGFHGKTPEDPDVVWLDNKRDFPVASWPKSNLRRPYELYSVSSSEATNWYDGMITSASLYDGVNQHNLEKLVPAHVQDDPLNANYFIFINMIGQHFDTVYNYVDHLTKTNTRDEYIYEGVSKNLIYDSLKSYGWDPKMGYTLDDIFSFKLGKHRGGGYLGGGVGSMQIANSQGNDIYGNEITTPFVVRSVQSEQSGSQTYYDLPMPASESITKEEVTKEQWKRILNNLPHLGKTKGTERSLRALLNTYGLPPSILRIREYGGIPKSGSAGQLLPRDQFKYALEFTGSQQLLTPWDLREEEYTINSYDQPTAQLIEFRFNTSYPEHQLLVVSSGSHAVVGDSWAVELEAHHSASQTTSGYYKHGRMNIYCNADSVDVGGGAHQWVSASSEWLPLFDNDWWNVQIGPKWRSDSKADNNRFKLEIAKAADYGNGRITHTGSALTEEVDSTIWWGPWNSANTHVPNYLFWGTNYSQSSAGTLDIINNYLFNCFTGSVVPPASSSTTGGSGHGHGYFHFGFSGSLQEIRYWEPEGYSTTEKVKENFFPTAVWENHVRDPLSIEAQYYTSSYRELVRRWPLGLDGAKHQLSGSGFIGIESSHPRGQYGHPTQGDFASGQVSPWHLSASGFVGTSDDWTAEEERMFTMMPEIIGSSPLGDKVRIDNTSITGSLSPFLSVQSSSLNLASKDSNVIGVYFSPNDIIDIDIARTFGGTKFSNFVGNPEDARSGSYNELKEISETYWQKYKTSPTFGQYMNILKFFDTSIFDQIEKMLPARANAQVGVLVKPNLLERPKFQVVPTETIELVTITGSALRIRPKVSAYAGSEISGSGGHTGFIRGFSAQDVSGIGDMTVGPAGTFQVYGEYEYNNTGVKIDKSSEQTVGYFSSDIDMRQKFGRDIDSVGFWETPSYITSQSGHFLIGETTSDDLPYVHAQRKSKKYRKTVFAHSSSINPITGLPQTTVASHSVIETEKWDGFPKAWEKSCRLGVKHGSVNYDIGGELTDTHDATLVGRGLRPEIFNVVEVVITNASDLFPDDLPESALGMGGGYTIGGTGNEFIELNFPESLIDDPSAGSGLGTYGCTDPGACNFNPMASNSDGYCLYPGNPLCPGVILTEPAQGCTHPGATNYWCNFNPCPEGIVPYTVDEDGSCEFPITEIDNMMIDVSGCTDQTAINYDMYATVDNGMCEYETVYDPPYGCNDPIACNYDPSATGQVNCIYPPHPMCPPVIQPEPIYGCMDPTFDSYDPSATVNSQDNCYNEQVQGWGAGGTMTTTGCTDPNANNYQAFVDIVNNALCEYSTAIPDRDEGLTVSGVDGFGMSGFMFNSFGETVSSVYAGPPGGMSTVGGATDTFGNAVSSIYASPGMSTGMSAGMSSYGR